MDKVFRTVRANRVADAIMSLPGGDYSPHDVLARINSGLLEDYANNPVAELSKIMLRMSQRGAIALKFAEEPQHKSVYTIPTLVEIQGELDIEEQFDTNKAILEILSKINVLCAHMGIRV